jgi:hypothetical protein
MEKSRQLIIVPGLLEIFSSLPRVEISALPATIVGPSGLALASRHNNNAPSSTEAGRYCRHLNHGDFKPRPLPGSDNTDLDIRMVNLRDVTVLLFIAGL